MPNIYRDQKKRSYRLPIHILRINAQVKILNEQKNQTIDNIHIILNDFSLSGMGFFSPVFMDFGWIIQLTFTQPIHLFTKAQVIWCKEFPTSNKIISQEQKLHFRIGVEFKPDSEEEKKSIEQLFHTLIEKQVFLEKKSE